MNLYCVFLDNYGDKSGQTTLLGVFASELEANASFGAYVREHGLATDVSVHEVTLNEPTELELR